MSEDKYKIGDLLISYPLSDHIGIVIDIEKDFYKTNFGRMNRITIRCETMRNRVFHLPETIVGIELGSEPAWRKVGEQ